MSDCTCVLLRYGDHLQPAEWEQNPLCREHPDAEYALDEIERLEAIVDRIPPDRLNPWHTVTVKADGWHMAHPIDCVLAECAFDGLAQAEWAIPPTAVGVWQWHEFEDEPGDWSEDKTNE